MTNKTSRCCPTGCWPRGNPARRSRICRRCCAAVGGLSAGQVVELCLTDQAFRWRTAEPMRVEDYLALCPPIARDPELVLDLAYGEIRTRQQLGDPPAAEEIDARFPALAARLHEQLEVGFWMDEGIAASPAPAGSRCLPVCVLHPSRSPAVPLPPICALHQSGRMGPYELGEVIAHGGMGVVFRARHVRLNRIVALKVIRPDRIANETDRRRFHNETVTVAQLDHPHIVPIYDVGEVDGVHYFTMKLMEGGDLQQHCRRYLDDPRAAAQVMADVAGAVHHAHQRGVLHRDVKPSNVLLDEAGRPHVTDFGLARRLDDEPELSDTGDLLGTPAYMAPEHLTPELGPLTVAADVYGLGAVLYVLLTGKPPFDGEHLVAVLESIRCREPTPPRRLNPRVDAGPGTDLLEGAGQAAGGPLRRAQELADDLQRFLAGEGVRARPLTWSAAAVAVGPPASGSGGRQCRDLDRRRRPADAAGRANRPPVRRCAVRWTSPCKPPAVHQAEAEANRREAARLRQSAEQLQAAGGGGPRRKPWPSVRSRGRRRTPRRSTTSKWLGRRAIRPSSPGCWTNRSRQAGQPDVRGFEWFVLDRLHRPRPERFPVFRGPVRSVGYSPDGRRIAAAGEPGLIQVLDAGTGRVLAFWPSLTTTRDLAFSPDGTLLAAVGDDGRVRILPAGGGASQVWPVATVPVWQVAFVGDGPLLATCDQDGKIRLIDRLQGQVAATLAGGPGEIECLAVAPDGGWLISGDRDGNLKVWDLATRQGVYEFNQGSTAHVKCLAVSADGTLVAIGDADGWVRVARLRRPWAHQWVLSGQHFEPFAGSRLFGRRTPRGRLRQERRRARLADRGRTGWRRFVPAAAGARLASSRGPGLRRRLPSAARSARHRRAGEPRRRLGTEGPRRRPFVGQNGTDDGAPIARSPSAPDSRLLAVAAEDGVQLWDLPTRKLHTRLSRDGQPCDHVTVSRDGQ